MLPKSNNVVPPKPGTPIPYTCRDCGEKFTVKKSFVHKPIKCPKCSSVNCWCMVQF